MRSIIELLESIFLGKAPRRRNRVNSLTVYVKTVNGHYGSSIHLMEKDSLELSDKESGTQASLFLKKGHRLYVTLSPVK